MRAANHAADSLSLSTEQDRPRASPLEAETKSCGYAILGREQKDANVDRRMPTNSAGSALDGAAPGSVEEADATTAGGAMTTPSSPPYLLSRADFVALYGGVYEHSPWVAEAVAAEGLTPSDDDPATLARRMAAVVEASGPDRQLALLRLHPELAGRLKVGEELTAASKGEQASARLDQCSPEEFARFQELNEAYGARFGFPFIIAVTGLDRAAILRAFEARVGNSAEAEFRTALDEVHKIARIRLDSLAARR
jgi:2-oxo-4-hydroxy-4-carboxy-5-ureidoimidazoline decarboxylase